MPELLGEFGLLLRRLLLLRVLRLYQIAVARAVDDRLQQGVALVA